MVRWKSIRLKGLDMPLCKHCNKSLADSSSLRRHERARHPKSNTNVSKTASRHQCSICQDNFTRAESLRRHARRHEGFVAACDICSRSFARDDYLSTHQLKCAKRFLAKACHSVEEVLCPGSYNPDTSLVRRVEPSVLRMAHPHDSGGSESFSALKPGIAPRFTHEYVLDIDAAIKALRHTMSLALEAKLPEDCEEAFVIAFRLNITMEALVDIGSLSGRPKNYARCLTCYQKSGNLRETLLHACNIGFAGLLEPLFWRGADFCYDHARDETPLVSAIWKGDSETVRLALALGADPEPRLLYHAINSGRREIVGLLVEYGANVNDQDLVNPTPLELAVSKGDLDMICFMLSLGVDATLGSPLQAAVLWDLADIATTLVQHGADIDNDVPSRWLREDALNGNVIVPSHWLRERYYGGKPCTALHVAVYVYSVESIRLALSLKADPDIGSPLLDAMEYRRPSIALLLLKHGASVSVKDDNGVSLLHFAAGTAHVGLLQAVLARDASPEFVNAVDHEGDTALHAAVDVRIYSPPAKDLSVVKILLDAGANMMSANKDGATPLSLAVGYGSVALVSLLLSRWPSSHQDTAGLFPLLHLAVQRECVDVVRVVVEAGAQDEDGTVLEVAYQKEIPGIISLIRGYES